MSGFYNLDITQSCIILCALDTFLFMCSIKVMFKKYKNIKGGEGVSTPSKKKKKRLFEFN